MFVNRPAPLSSLFILFVIVVRKDKIYKGYGRWPTVAVSSRLRFPLRSKRNLLDLS